MISRARTIGGKLPCNYTILGYEHLFHYLIIWYVADRRLSESEAGRESTLVHVQNLDVQNALMHTSSLNFTYHNAYLMNVECRMAWGIRLGGCWTR